MGPAAHAFVDGGYLHGIAATLGVTEPDPSALCRHVMQIYMVKQWSEDLRLLRIGYYDAAALPGPEDSAESAKRRDYWRRVEILPDTHLGFGTVRRGTRKPREQKGVDTLIAVDMLVGAFTRTYDLAILVSGDADFVPVLEEVRRRGASVVVVAEARSLSDDLRRAADRTVEIIAQPKEAEGAELKRRHAAWCTQLA